MNSTLIYGIATLGVSLAALTIRYTFKSKCNDVSLCFGCLKIKRDTDAEIKEEELQHTIKRGESQKDISLQEMKI